MEIHAVKYMLNVYYTYNSVRVRVLVTHCKADNKEPCAAHKRARALQQKSAFNLFSDKEKPFIV